MNLKNMLDVNRLYSIVRLLLLYALAIALAFFVTGILLYAMHQDVLLGYKTILLTSFSSMANFSLTLFKFVPIYLLGLGFSIPLMTRKFNVGIEGQFLLGAIGASITGILLASLPSYLLVPAELLAAIALGALWASVPAILLFFFNVNEIISTILMNFISFYLVDLIALGPWRDQTAGHPMTIPISPSGHLPLLLPEYNINIGSIISVSLSLLSFVLIYKLVIGYEMRASGSNPIAATKFGIKASILGPLSLIVGGMVAGLAGGIESTGLYFRLVEGMQSRYANLAILVSLMAKGNPITLLLTSFFFSIIEVGANAMQRTVGTPYELILITEAIMMLLVMSVDVIRAKKRW